MIEITIFQLWYLFDLKFDRLKEKKINDIRPFCRWLKGCEFSWTMDAARGYLVNIPEYILEWGAGYRGRPADAGRRRGGDGGAMTLTFGSLFAGIGGFDLGFERAGMVCKWQVEIDEYRRKVLAKHWPEVERYGDVRECGAHNLGAIDVICGGFPCQPHSLAGKREGAADDRNLWPEYRRIVTELQPGWVIAENVFGIVSTMLDTVLSDLEDLDYTTISLIVPACAFDAPHRRDRVFVVAHAKSAGLEKRQGITRDIKQKFQAVERSGNGNGIRFMAHAKEQPKWPGLCQDQQTEERWGRSVNSSGKGRRVWQPESGVGRVANGVPHRVDRTAALGDAVIPQAAEWIGQQLVAIAGGEVEKTR